LNNELHCNRGKDLDPRQYCVARRPRWWKPRAWPWRTRSRPWQWRTLRRLRHI
jgi:hypothetical protein